MLRRFLSRLGRKGPVAEDTPAHKLARLVAREATTRGATEIEVAIWEANEAEPRGSVRFKIGGEWHERLSPPGRLTPSLIAVLADHFSTSTVERGERSLHELLSLRAFPPLEDWRPKDMSLRVVLDAYSAGCGPEAGQPASE